MLSLDLATILFQMANFVVLAYVLNRWALQPILRQSAQRAEERVKLMRDLATERHRLAEARAELDRKSAALDEEADRILAEARRKAQQEQQQLLSEARAEAEELAKEAQTGARQLRRQSLERLRGEVVDTILEISSNTLARVAPPEVHDRLVQRLAERIREMGRTDMSRVEAIRRSIGRQETIASIESARELTAEQQAQLARLLTAVADHRVNIELSVEPGLVAGISVRLGDTVMDSSIAGQLQELRADVAHTLANSQEDQ
ncbi:MAG TPA: F0F1 ATP synthase subunit delta [Anaerolineae bacterium]|nr:F0F1 ATP synthase subunit delta [Anaerolineae bacterium]